MKALAVTLSSLMLMTLSLAYADEHDTPMPEKLAETPIFLAPGLRSAVAAHLRKPEDVAITARDMAKLTHLYAGRREIKDLTGLEFATNLTDLDLNNNQIGNLSPLAALVNLEYLNISDNPLSASDLTPIAGLTNLEFLNLAETEISDLSALAALTNLVTLELWRNSISDLTPLAGLTQLEILFL